MNCRLKTNYLQCVAKQNVFLLGPTCCACWPLLGRGHRSCAGVAQGNIFHQQPFSATPPSAHAVTSVICASKKQLKEGWHWTFARELVTPALCGLCGEQQSRGLAQGHCLGQCALSAQVWAGPSAALLWDAAEHRDTCLFVSKIFLFSVGRSPSEPEKFKKPCNGMGGESLT